MKMSCKEATYAISDRLDRKLGPIEWLKLRTHLFICHYCRDFAKQTQFMRVMVRAARRRRH
ncbi:MAG: zf-HC2 domain-containing protein [Burkholderiales bacterium]|nr:zf-HC2 domain-containing protein [Burkholderiales bacterium]